MSTTSGHPLDRLAEPETAELRAVRTEMETMRVQNIEQGRELRQTQRDQEENLRLVEQLRETVQQMTTKNNSLRINKTAFETHMGDFQDMRQRMTALEEQKRQAEQRLATASSLSRSMDRMAESNRRQDKSECEHLQSERADTLREVDRLQSRMADRDREIANKQEEHNRLRSELDARRTELDTRRTGLETGLPPRTAFGSKRRERRNLTEYSDTPSAGAVEAQITADEEMARALQAEHEKPSFRRVLHGPRMPRADDEPLRPRSAGHYSNPDPERLDSVLSLEHSDYRSPCGLSR